MSTNLELGLKDATETPRPVIDIRYGQVGLVQVRIHTTDPGDILDELTGRVAAAPHFFRRTAVGLDLSALEEPPEVAELRGVTDAIRRVGMLSVGLIGDAAHLQPLAIALDLPMIAGFRPPVRAVPVLSTAQAVAAPPIAPPAPMPEPVAPPEATLEPQQAQTQTQTSDGAGTALLHTQPVRSGQRVHARHRDLIVTATVAAGAEVMADGCLHIYGSLRGRALAGAHGDLSARVFCQEFHAELVSIAGVFRIFETIPADLAGKPVQVWLSGDELRCARIGA